jgi:hypothetical protein
MWDLASQEAGEIGQTGLANQSGRFCPELAENPSETKATSRTSPPLNKKSHSTTETFLLKNTSRQPTGLNRSDRLGKPVKPVLPGQSGRTHLAGKTPLSKRSISRFVPRIKVKLWDSWGTSWLPLARSSVPKTHSIKRNRKSTIKNTFPWKPTETPKSKPFRRDCWSKITKQGGMRSSYVTSNKNSSKNTLKTSPRKFQEKAPKITKKEKREKHKQVLTNHAESSIHT